MNRNSRTLALVAAAVAVAVTGFLALRPSDDSSSSSSSTTTSAPGSPAATTTSTKGDGPSTLPDATVIHVVGGQPVGGRRKITVKKGDTIRLKVTSDQAGEIHVHGFDLEQEAAPGKPASFTFTANIEGRFEVESHVGNVQIAEISVNP